VTNDSRGLKSSAEQSGGGEAVHESEAVGDPDLAVWGERPGWCIPRPGSTTRSCSRPHGWEH
jgi:hypothetical protein